MATNKHTAVWDWLQTCPLILDTFFNFSTASDGDTVIAPVTAFRDTVAEEYVDGSTLRYYDFALIRYANYTNEPNDTENISDLLDVEAVAAWIEAQDDAGSYPAFPAACSVQEVRILPTSTGFVAAQSENRAKYMVQIRIEYIEAA